MLPCALPSQVHTSVTLQYTVLRLPATRLSTLLRPPHLALGQPPLAVRGHVRCLLEAPLCSALMAGTHHSKVGMGECEACSHAGMHASAFEGWIALQARCAVCWSMLAGRQCCSSMMHEVTLTCLVLHVWYQQSSFSTSPTTSPATCCGVPQAGATCMRCPACCMQVWVRMPPPKQVSLRVRPMNRTPHRRTP